MLMRHRGRVVCHVECRAAVDGHYQLNVDTLHIGPTVDRVGKRWADFENWYCIDAHTLLGLRAGWANDRWRAYADIRNLTDEKYVVSHAVRNVASPGDAVLNAGEPLSATSVSKCGSSRGERHGDSSCALRCRLALAFLRWAVGTC
jgi:hypothetical protein